MFTGRFAIPVPNFYACFKSKKKVVPVVGDGSVSRPNNSVVGNTRSSKSAAREKEEQQDNIRLETFRNKPRALLANYASNSRQQQAAPHDNSLRRKLLNRGAGNGINDPNKHTPILNPNANAVVVNDVMHFVHGLNLVPDKCRHPLMIGDMCALVGYEHDGPESLGSSNPLGNFLLRAMLNKLNYVNATNTEEVNYLLMSIDIATTFIEYMRSMEEGAEHSSFWIPLQGCLALTDIVLLASFVFVESNTAFPQDSFEGFVQALDCLFQKLHSLGPLLECESELVIKMLFCQTMSRACLVVQALSLQCSQVAIVLRNKLASRLVSVLQSLAPNMALCRQVCGETSRDVSILFWSQCDSTVDQVLTLIAGTGTLQRVASDKRSIRTAGEIVALPPQNVAGSLAMKMSAMNRIRHALILTIPTPQELFMEICRLKNANPRNATVSFAYDGVDDDIDNMQADMDGDICGLIFLRVKHALSGFQFLLRLGTVDAKDLKLSMPNIDDWVSSLAESLFLVLSTFAEGRNEMMSVAAFDFLVDLAPILSESFFHVYVGTDLTSHYDWIFWEMTKRMSNFVEASKQDIKRFRSALPSKPVTATNRTNQTGTTATQYLNGTLNSANTTEDNNNSIRDAFHSARSQDDTSRTEKSGLNASTSQHTPGMHMNSRKSSPASLDAHGKPGSPTKIINIPMSSTTAATNPTPVQAPAPAPVLTISALSNPESGRANKGRLPPLGLNTMGNAPSSNLQTPNALSASSSATTLLVPAISLPSLQMSQSLQTLGLDGADGTETNQTISLAGATKKKKKYTGRHAVNMDLLKPNSLLTSQSEAPTPTKVNPAEATSAEEVFVVGQAVDGLVELANGTKRWYPGKITAANVESGTYDVAYEDGDIQLAKAAKDIRKSKRVKTANASTAGNTMQIQMTNESPTVTVPILVAASPAPAPSMNALTIPSLAILKVDESKSFAVGQAVEGLYQLPNGTKRWFAGHISKVGAGSNCYDVTYNDGDIQVNKPAEEIRPSRKAAQSQPQPSSAAATTSISVTTAAVDARPSSKGYEQQFTVGTKVDGLVQLASGASRWYSGVVDSVNTDGTYNVQYDDGDKQINKPHTDLRHSKKLPRNVVKNKEPPQLSQQSKKSPNPMLLDVEELSSKLLNISKSTSRSSDSQTGGKAAGASGKQQPSTDYAATVTLQASAGFDVDDLVDGLVCLANGTSRWYPGRIAAVNADETYDIIYDDGDHQKNKPEHEVRITKRSPSRTKRSGSSPNGNNGAKTVPSLLASLSPEHPTKGLSAALSPSAASTPTGQFFVSSMNGSSTSRGNPGHHYSIGETVECVHPSSIPPASASSGLSPPEPKWVQGKITAVNLDGTFDVDFADGDFQKFKNPREIRPSRSPAGSARHSSRATTERSSMSSQKTAASPRSLSCYNVSDGAERPMPVPMAALSSIKSEEEDNNTTASVDLIEGKGKEGADRNSVMAALEAPSTKTLTSGPTTHTLHAMPSDSKSVLTINTEASKLDGEDIINMVNVSTNNDDDDSDDDSEHGFFAIPSIFANGVVRAESTGKVPLVSLSKAKFPSSSNAGPSPQSLSASLNYDAMSDCASEKGANKLNAFLNENVNSFNAMNSNNNSVYGQGNGIVTSNSHYGGAFNSHNLSSHNMYSGYNSDTNSNVGGGPPTGHKSRKFSQNDDHEFTNIMMKPTSAGGVQRMLSWRERKDDSSGIYVDYRRLSGRSTTSNPGNFPSVGGTNSAYNTFRGAADLDGLFDDGPAMRDPSVLDLNLNLLSHDEFGEEYVIPDVLLRSYNIVCIVLLKRCIIDRYFLDHACCSSRVISHASHMHFTSSGVGGMSSKNYEGGYGPPTGGMSAHNTGRPTSVRSGRPNSRPSSARSQQTSNDSLGNPHTVPLKHINLLFNLREYLEFIPAISDNFFYLGELANAMGPCYSRILKLLHHHYFQCCLPMHIASAEKVGEGGFGSIFRITCPDLCGEVNSKRRFLNPLRKITKKDVTPSASADGRMPIENRSNWKHCNCKASIHCAAAATHCVEVNAHGGRGSGIFHKPNNLGSSDAGTPLPVVSTNITSKRKEEGSLSRFGSEGSLVDGTQYAVKRIPRERSVHDNQVLSAIYNEVTSLAALEGVIGVCQLLDYGVFLSEYWLVMELGGKNLSEWRRRAIDAEDNEGSHVHPSGAVTGSPAHKHSHASHAQNALYSRMNSEISGPVNDFSNFSKEVLSINDCAMCLTMFVDILFIVKAVHAADVGHFDIKCNNFVLKHEGRHGTHSEGHVPISAARAAMHDSFDSNVDGTQATSQSNTAAAAATTGTNAIRGTARVPGVLADVRTLREAHDKKKPSGQIILIDFGEAMPYMSAIKSRPTVASTSAKCRGTLCIQSPEIISISSNASNQGSNARGRNGAVAPKFPLPNKASDIWSLGCLLVELLTGNYLFADRQWADLYVTLARTPFDEKTIPLDTLRHSLSELPEDVRTSIEQLVKKILVQMPADRPAIEDIIRMTNNILGNYLFAPLFRNDKENHNLANTSGNSAGLNVACKSSDLDELRRTELQAISRLTVELTDTVITLSDSVIFQVEAPFAVPILLTTQYAVPRGDETGTYGGNPVDNRKAPSLLATNIKGEVLKTDLEASLMSRFELVEKVIATASLSRLVKDTSSRLLRSWALQNSLVQVIVASSRRQKQDIYRYITQYGVRSAIHVVLVSPEDEGLEELLPKISQVFGLACNALSHHQRVVVTVYPLDEEDLLLNPQNLNLGPDGYTGANGSSSKEVAADQQYYGNNGDLNAKFPKFSKLAVTVALAMADGLSIWSNAGSGRKKEAGKFLIDPNICEQANTSHGVGNYAPDIENAVCRRMVDVILEYVDRDADYQLCYQERPK